MNVSKHFPRVLLFLLFVGFIALFQSCDPNEPADETNYKYNDNTVRIRLSTEPGRINPILEPSSNARLVFDHIYMELMDFDPVSLEMVPLLVKNKPIVTNINDGDLKGGVSYTYEIRDEAVWDDGTPITAADVEFSIKLLFAPGLPNYYQSYYEYVRLFEIDPNDPQKFTISADQKYIVLGDVLDNTYVLQENHFDPNGILKKFSLADLKGPDAKKLETNAELKSFADNFMSPKYSLEIDGILGSGPYKYAGRVAEQYILLVKKENWWGAKFANNSPQMQAYPDTLMFKIISDPAAAITALKDQELDVTNSIESKSFSEFADNELITSVYNLHAPPTHTVFQIYLNTRLPKLADPRVRRALAHLMDVDEFLESLYYGYGKRTNGPIMEFEPYYNSDLPLIDYSPEKAKALLADAGWKDSDNDGILEKEINGKVTNLDLEILIGKSKASENIAVFYQNAAKKAGINMTILKKEGKEAINMSRKGEYEIYPGAVRNDLAAFDPKEQWHSIYATAGGRNYSGFGDAKTDAIIDSIRVTLNTEKRHQLYKAFQKEVYDQTPAIFLFNPTQRIAVHKRFDMKISNKRPNFHPNTFKLKE